MSSSLVGDSALLSGVKGQSGQTRILARSVYTVKVQLDFGNQKDKDDRDFFSAPAVQHWTSRSISADTGHKQRLSAAPDRTHLTSLSRFVSAALIQETQKLRAPRPTNL